VIVDALPLPLGKFLHSGYAAVSLFYVLSGFVLAVNYMPRFAEGTVSTREFFAARFSRIYPLYLLAVLWSAANFLFLYGVPSHELVTPTVASVLAIQAWQPNVFMVNYNSASWSISDELFFYAAFPLVCALLFRRRRDAAWCLGVLAVAWVVGLVAPAVEIARHAADTTFVRFSPICRLPEFVVGVALGGLYMARVSSPRAPADADRRARAGDAMSVAALVLLIAVTQLEWQIPHPLFHDGLLAPLFALLLYGLASGRFFTRLFAARPFVVLGEASFAIYILQFPVSGLLKLLPSWFTQSGWQILEATFLPMVIAVSLAAHYGVERPMRVRLSRALVARTARVAARP
jgi:peptidoglycan/LPS O-acetylase OafA/YrhL